MKPETGRNSSFIKVIDILEQTYGHPIIIVETGCIRNTTEESKFGDGWSTLNWEYYAKKTNSTVYVVDIDEKDPFKYTDIYFNLKSKLEEILKHQVDLLEERAIKNIFFRKELELTKVKIYGY